jgi:diguanylate cyclase
MNSVVSDIAELHLLLGVIQNVDVGLVILDRDYRIRSWNGFMENHSGLSPSSVIGEVLFEQFPEIPEASMRKKLETVFLLNNRAFTTWQQRPYLMKFDSYRPITGRSEVMFQNMTIFPLASTSGQVEHVCLMLYDVTEQAIDEQALQAANRELDLLGRTDGLTGLYNRRTWEEYLAAEFKRYARSSRASALIMFDIDHFKRVNDTYGHQAGDEVIRRVAETLKKTMRESDIGGRYGGEEFGVVLPDTDNEGGVVFAERLRRMMEQTPVAYDGQHIEFTISLGIAEISGQLSRHTDWLEQADKALYQSKEGGRNRATVYQE